MKKSILGVSVGAFLLFGASFLFTIENSSAKDGNDSDSEISENPCSGVGSTLCAEINGIILYGRCTKKAL